MSHLFEALLLMCKDDEPNDDFRLSESGGASQFTVCIVVNQSFVKVRLVSGVFRTQTQNT